MKRIIAIILVIATLLTTMLSLAGCGVTSADSALSMGQWVTLIADSFGMQNYLEDKPYFKNVVSSDSTFAAFQMVAEWNIIKPSDAITSSTPVTWNDVLISLVNAGEFLDENTTDKEKIDYAIKNFDPSIRTYWGNRYIKLKEAIPLLDTAQQMWCEKSIENPVNEAKFTEKVKNYLDTDVQYTVENEKIKLPISQAEEISSGDVFALPCSGENAAMIKKATNVIYNGEYAYIDYEEVPDDELGEYAESVIVRESTDVDFSKVIGIYDEAGNPIAFEEDSSNNYSGLSHDSSSYSVTPLTYSNTNNSGIVQLGRTQKSNPHIVNTGLFDNVKGEITLPPVNGNKFTLSLSKDGFGLKWSKDSNKKNNQYRDTKTTTSVGITCSNITLDKDIDISWGKIKSATLKIGYDVTIDGGVKVTTNNKVGQQDADGSNVNSSLKNVIRGYQDALSKITTGVNETKYTNDSVYICRIKLANGGLASLDFIVKGVVTVTGEMKIVIELEGCQGLEYKNGKVRYINSKGVDTDFKAEGKIEMTISPGFAITILSKWQIGEILLDLGAGVSASYTAHLFDAENHHIHTEKGITLSAEDVADLESVKQTISAEELEAFAKEQGGNYIADSVGESVELFRGFCLEFKLYPIIRLKVGDGLLPNLLKSAKVGLTVDFLNEKNVSLTGHLDFGPSNSAAYLQAALQSETFNADWKKTLGIGEKCSFNFKPWDSVETELPLGDEEPTIDQSDILTTESITLSSMRVSLNVGESQYVTITGLPKGYTVEDVIAKSDDKEIAAIDIRYGKVTAQKKTGTTQIVVMTKDEKHKAYFAVTVVDDNKVGFDGLK